MITAAKPRALIRRSQQCIHFGPSEKANQGSAEALAWDGNDTLDLCRMSRQLKSGITKERVDRCQPQVTATGGQSALLFEMIQKRHDQWRIDLFKEQVGGLFLQPLLRKLQEHPECVAIGTDRMRADLSLLHEALREKTFQKRSKLCIGDHDGFSQRRSSRFIASRISSGHALRYQNVSAT